MAIQALISGSTPASQDLRLAAAYPATKRNYTTALTVGGASGQVVGHWRATWVRMPAAYANNGRPAIMGSDSAATASFGSGNDTVVRIPGDAFGTVALRRRVAVSVGTAWATGEGDLTGMAQLGYSSTALIIDGVINIGTNAAPVWRNFATVCLAGGTPETFVGATATVSTFLTATTTKLFHQVFAAQSTSTARTPAGLALEHAALVVGDFPWDSVNARPHHDAIRALAGSGANPFLNYQGLVDAQNAGTLPYANLRSNADVTNPRPGRGTVEFWFTLSNLTAGLVNQGTLTGLTLSIATQASNPNPLEAVANIAPAHWTPGIVAPAITVPRAVSGRFESLGIHKVGVF